MANTNSTSGGWYIFWVFVVFFVVIFVIGLVGVRGGAAGRGGLGLYANVGLLGGAGVGADAEGRAGMVPNGLMKTQENFL